MSTRAMVRTSRSQRAFHRMGSPIYGLLSGVWLFCSLGVRVFRHLWQPWRTKEIYRHLSEITLGSLPIIGISTAFAGVIISNEMARHMNHALHTVEMIPGFSGQFIMRELGVILPAMLLVAKVGASMTAEISLMKVTEQLDALKLLKIDLIEYLVFPRWIATVMALVILTMIALGITLGFAMTVAVLRFNFNVLQYIQALRTFLNPVDLAVAVTKSIAFGMVVPLVSFVYAFRCQGGAQGVGEATTQSVVTSTILVIILDFLVISIFSSAL